MNIIVAASVIFLVGGLSLPYCSAAQSLLDRVKRDEITMAADDDPAMAAAFKKARAGLEDFLVLAKNPPAHLRTVAVKVGVTDRRGTEYFWIVPFREESTAFVGKINNHPRMVKSVKFGQEIRFTKREIVDWMYFDSQTKRIVGNFTSCALLAKEPPAEAEKLRKEMGTQCDA